MLSFFFEEQAVCKLSLVNISRTDN